VKSRDSLKEILEFGAASSAAVARGEKSPQRSVQLVHGELAAEAIANSGRGLKEGKLIPIEVHCRKRG